MPIARGDMCFIVTPDESGARFDTFLSQHLDELSRSQAALLIRRGAFAIDDEARKPGYRVRTGESVMGRIPPPVPTDLMPEAIPLQVLFEDHALIVINKPAGLVVHPAAGHPSGTLVNALLHHCPNLEGIGGEKRPGIVHRLDKNTSGLLIVAKNNTAHQDLSRQFKERLIHKQYLALVSGVPPEPSGTIDLPLARHPMERKKMAVSNHSGREAITVWHMREQFPEATLLAITIKTGRTHQIRVHCQAMGHPIIGDPVYGRRRTASTVPALRKILKQARRQMLHAAHLRFTHPTTGAALEFDASLPEDMSAVLTSLRTIP